MGSNGTTLITGATTVLVGEGLDPVPAAVVAIVGERIDAVGRAGAVTVPAEAHVIDAGGLTILPGFIDAHVHIAFYPPAEVLRGGVTTCRDLAWPPDEIWPRVADSRSASFDGPEIVATGQMVTVERGYPTRASWAPPGTGRVITGGDDAVNAVEEQAERGAVAIKVAVNSLVGPVLDRITLSTVVRAAHERGLPVTGHVHALSDLDIALDAGIDELAHMLLSGETIPDGVIGRMVEKGVVVVPTLSCFRGRSLRKAVDNLARFLEAGGRVVYGTDLGNDGPRPGIDRTEIEAMSAAGMSGRDVIVSATAASATHLGLTDRGRIERGALADLIGVRGDPIADPQVLVDPALVVRKGVVRGP